MDKNYYEILEINNNASQEIVEKAYKTLAKKYHPDLQEGSKKIEYEEKLKKINEAYEVLSDPEKRANYDTTLPKTSISAEDYETLYRQKEYMKQRITRMEQQQQQNDYQSNQTFSNKSNTNNQNYQEQINNAINKAYHDAYIQDLKRRGYKIKYKKSWRDYVAAFMTILVLIIIFSVLLQIPPIKNYFIELYNSNILIRTIVDVFFGFFN